MSAVPKFMNDKKIEHFWTAITADNSRREIQKKARKYYFSFDNNKSGENNIVHVWGHRKFRLH